MNNKKDYCPRQEASLSQDHNAAGGYKPNRQFLFKAQKPRSSIDYYCLEQYVKDLQQAGYKVTCRSYRAIGNKTI